LDVTEWASIVNAATVIILVVINAYYLKIAKRQTEAAIAQAKESQRQADAAMETLRLSKAQAHQQAEQELTIVVSMLRGIAADVEFWKRVVKERWEAVPPTVHLIPDDWPLAVYHAGRLSPELREKALDIRAMLANANYHIARFLSAPPGARDASILDPAYENLVKVTPELHHIIEALSDLERSGPPLPACHVGRLS
jgi:hypothetical protein